MRTLPIRFLDPDGTGGAGAGGAEGTGDDAGKGADAGKVDPRDAKLAELEARLAELTKAAGKLADVEKDAADKAAKLAAMEAREAERIAKLDKANAATVAKIPADRRTLVPAALTGEALAEWLELNRPHLFGEVERPAGTVSRGKSADEISDAELTEDIRRAAAVRNMDPKTWAKILKAARPAKA